MNKLKERVLAIGLFVVVFLGSSVPAHAASNFDPNPNSAGSCGLGRDNAAAARSDKTAPGASEIKYFPPKGICTGK